MITIHTRKTTTKALGEHFLGAITVWESSEKLYEIKSKIPRLNREDALEDAKDMRKEIEAK